VQALLSLPGDSFIHLASKHLTVQVLMDTAPGHNAR
jgi:hypothetical protein